MLMRRSGSFQPTAPPHSEDSLNSFSSSNSRKRARRTKRRPQSVNAWAFVIRILLLIVAFLSVFDFVLFWKSRFAKHSSIEEEDYHHQKNREPPLLVKDNPEDTKSEDDDDEDMEPIYEILRQARIHPAQLSPEQKSRLPTWSTVQRLYGDAPKIYGLDTCEKFRNTTEPSLTFLAMAGTFNSGTNLLASLMIRNCQIDERMKVYGEKQKGMRWQVKWVRYNIVFVVCCFVEGAFCVLANQTIYDTFMYESYNTGKTHAAQVPRAARNKN
jgi:hypothetical protein